MLDREKPEPGVYPDIPEADYFALPAANASTLKVMGRSAAHCKARLDGPARQNHPGPGHRQSAARAVLEPDRFPVDFIPEPQPADHGALTDLPSYKAVAKGLGLKTSGTKAQLKEAILAAVPETRFWGGPATDSGGRAHRS